MTRATTSKIRAVIVDDEELARQVLREFIGAHPEIELIAECANGFEAVKIVTEQKPDLMFLDIQMPKLDGFEVLELIGNNTAVVFVTAYDSYAIKAFEVHAVDYLLKPFDAERLRAAVARARARLDQERSGLGQDLANLVELLRTRSSYLERIALKSAGRISFVRVEELDCIEAEGNYVRLCLAGEEHLLRSTLSALEGRLDPNRFVRVHRSAIVNVERVQELRSSQHGEHAITLRSGRRLTLSRGYRDRLQTILDGTKK
jgi:two-component system, LytTR family, response regulator